jgi:hypothetical protein
LFPAELQVLAAVGRGKIIYGENLSTVGLTDFSESVTATTLPYVVPFDGFAVVSWQAVWQGSPTFAWFPILFNNHNVHTTVETQGLSYVFSFPVKKGVTISSGDVQNAKFIQITVYKIK